MSIYEIIILSVALALDAMLVSFSYGLIIKNKRLYNSLSLSFSFGFFQFLMPVLGWILTGYVYNYLKMYSKWIVFTVFIWLGIKFIKEAFVKENSEIRCISFLCILCLALATSIDAFGAGVSIRFSDTGVIFPALMIGIITFILSIFGFYAAGIFAGFPKKYVNISGAALLFYLALKSII